MADKQTFEAMLNQHPGMEATGITIPFDVEKVYGAKRVPVKAYINEVEYQGSIVRLGGEYCLGIPKVIREKAGIKAGGHIVVTIVHDTEERTVEVPEDLSDALAARELREAWNTISYSQRKELVRAIGDAKQPETRRRRIDMALRAADAKKKQ
jgi:uncharacterized protein YdeI (YjbR/CyaY-like superfamily)